MPIMRNIIVVLATVAIVTVMPRAALADFITLKTGVVLQGDVDKNNTILSVFDGLKRVIVRDTKVASIASAAPERFEAFRIDQPLIVHGGEMPGAAIGIKAEPWSEKGRRAFQFQTRGGGGSIRTVQMTQAINDLGPKSVGIRGIDGFWRARLATSQVPREVVLNILAHVEQGNQNERLKVGRFLIQAEWYPEALDELSRIARDFPAVKETAEGVRRTVQELQARRFLAETDNRRRSGQFHDAAARLRAFPTEGAPSDVLVTVRNQVRQDEAAHLADKALADAILKASETLSDAAAEPTRGATVELLRELADAPDAVRDRFVPFQAADPALPAEKRYALALSGWVIGKEGATDDLATASLFWKARQALKGYLSAGATQRPDALAALQTIVPPETPGNGTPLGVQALSRIVRLMPPPGHDPQQVEPGKPRLMRARDDANSEPTEYVVVLPPEYHPVRHYPAILVLHGGEGADAAAKRWSAEAARRGFIVLAPEYNVRGQKGGYRYSVTEHSAVEIALRDARKRFAIDSDRVFLGGAMLGGDMAWDLGLGHPDLFAGVAVVSGLPARYVYPYKDNAKLVPYYFVIGDLAPAETEVIQPFGLGLVGRNFDFTYVEYYKRGLEDLPEETAAIFDWMSVRRRDPHPREFAAVSARECDNRFFGVVIKDFQPRRALPPEQVDPLGKNVRPATIEVKHRTAANIYDISTNGVANVDLWLGPQFLDLNKKFEIRINGKTAFKGLVKPDLAPFLEDLRVRGDREQVYWLRYAANLGAKASR